MRVNNKLILSALLAANFLIAPAVALADGYPDTGPEAQAQLKKSVKKASIKKPVKKKAASKPKKQVAIKRAVLTPVRKSSLERGKELMNQHRYEEARPWLQKAVQEQRRSAEAWYLYGLYHECTGRFSEAQYFYTKAVQIDPLFDPLSRIMTYPNDTKTALWDKRRPGRVYEIPTATRNGTIIPPNSPQASRLPNRPDAQNNPVVPKVPVYTPPEPGAAPNDGDAWSPSVYVPPSANNLNSGGQVYTPPSPNNNLNNFEPELELEAEAENKSSVVYNPPLPVIYEQSKSEAAYNPPAPEVKAASSSSTTKKVAKAPAKKQTARAKAKTNTKSRAKRAANNNQQAQAQPQNNSQAQPARQAPQAQARPQNNSQAQARQQTQTRQQQRVRINELPPVGQTTNNGTFEVPLPPVGQR